MNPYDDPDVVAARELAVSKLSHRAIVSYPNKCFYDIKLCDHIVRETLKVNEPELRFDRDAQDGSLIIDTRKGSKEIHLWQNGRLRESFFVETIDAEKFSYDCIKGLLIAHYDNILVAEEHHA